MRLVARSPSCFSSQYVLKLDGRPVGQFQGRWFSEGINIRLTERLQLHFEKTSWLGSNFQLLDANSSEILAQGSRSGFFARNWNLSLRTGPAKLVRTSLFSTAFAVQQQGKNVANASRIGWCEGGWQVEDHGTLDATDLVFIGLVYHTILRRQRNSQQTSP